MRESKNFPAGHLGDANPALILKDIRALYTFEAVAKGYYVKAYEAKAVFNCILGARGKGFPHPGPRELSETVRGNSDVWPLIIV